MDPFLASIIISVILSAISYALQPTPKTPKGRPPFGLGEFDFPTAQEGRPIPVIFGKRFIEGPNVTWSANLRVVEITE